MPIARPTIEELQKHYPATGEMSRENLFRTIGWDREIDNVAFLDTCAIRVSIGLIGCRVPVKGRVKILKGPFKDKWIEPGQRYLSYFLRDYWGKPEKFKADELYKLSGQCGIISHFSINPESPIAQGHIDVLDPEPKNLFKCASRCHWRSAETWFWELPRGIASETKK